MEIKSKYTKEERHNIYIQAKEKYIEAWEDGLEEIGICKSIFRSAYVPDIEIDFPEMNIIKPKGKTYTEYWWNLNFTRKRTGLKKDVTITTRYKKFDKLIKMTE